MVLIALYCSRQSRAPNIDRCTPENLPWPLTLTRDLDLDLWPWPRPWPRSNVTVTYDLDLPLLGKCIPGKCMPLLRWDRETYPQWHNICETLPLLARLNGRTYKLEFWYGCQVEEYLGHVHRSRSEVNDQGNVAKKYSMARFIDFWELLSMDLPKKKLSNTCTTGENTTWGVFKAYAFFFTYGLEHIWLVLLVQSTVLRCTVCS